MSEAFTSGPWVVDLHLNVMHEGHLVAFPSISNGRLQQAANARLIAAAPDLLQALRDGRRVLAIAIRANWAGATEADVSSHITIKQMDAALAKAGAQP